MPAARCCIAVAPWAMRSGAVPDPCCICVCIAPHTQQLTLVAKASYQRNAPLLVLVPVVDIWVVRVSVFERLVNMGM
jgi:hypothetical protein